MKVCGITAEYNPFHNGHAYQISKARAAGATHILAVMSGNFVQRGEPALLEKHIRAKAALAGGVDLVVELPLPFATASAEAFSYGALFLMQAAGCVEMVSFGAEDALPELIKVKETLSQPGFEEMLRRELERGVSFPSARAKAVAALAGEDAAEILSKPNNILGVEYLKAASRLGFAPQWTVVSRKGAGHDQPGLGLLMSASQIRTLLAQNDWDFVRPGLSESAAVCYQNAFHKGEGPVTAQGMERQILAVLRGREPAFYKDLPDMREGLENRFLAGVRQAVTLEGLYQAVQSKRYPQSRVRRMALHGFLGVTARMQKTPPPYLRVLAIGPGGEEILRRMKQTAAVPVSQSLAKLAGLSSAAREFALLESSATDQYVLAMPHPKPCGWDFSAPVVKG